MTWNLQSRGGASVMRAIITGGGGQLATELVQSIPTGWSVSCLTRNDLDITDTDTVAAAVDRLAPDLIINAAAHTAVDRAESEADLAFAINRDGAANLARCATRRGVKLVHVSTDFVFDGHASRPYLPGDTAGPLGVYGASKHAGEIAVAQYAPNALIVRTAWVYAAHGRNFLTTMLRLMGKEEEVRVVSDQIGTPTSAKTLARALWELAQSPATGILHFTDAGVASWYDFAQAIAEESFASGVLKTMPRVTPIKATDYPTPAPRPGFSVLDKSETWALLGKPPVHWRAALREVLVPMSI